MWSVGPKANHAARDIPYGLRPWAHGRDRGNTPTVVALPGPPSRVDAGLKPCSPLVKSPAWSAFARVVGRGRQAQCAALSCRQRLAQRLDVLRVGGEVAGA